MYESLRAGHPVVLAERETLADSLLGGIGHENRFTFRLVREQIDEAVLVSEEAIAQGMAYLSRHHRMMVEGAAATGVAALLSGKVSGLGGGSTAVIITGNSVDVPSFLHATSRYLNEG